MSERPSSATSFPREGEGLRLAIFDHASVEFDKNVADMRARAGARYADLVVDCFCDAMLAATVAGVARHEPAQARAMLERAILDCGLNVSLRPAKAAKARPAWRGWLRLAQPAPMTLLWTLVALCGLVLMMRGQ